MPTTKFLASLIGVAIAAGTLSGCEGGLNLGGMFGGGDAPPAEEQVVVKKPKRKRVPPAKAAAGKGATKAASKGATKTADAKGADGAPTAEGSPASSPAPALKPRAFLMRNVAFDAMRTRAMRLVYEGQTKKALATFQDAERARPTDPAVKMWVAAIRESAQKARVPANGAETEFNTAAQQLRVPALPAGAPAAPAAPPAGAAPTLPRPRAIANSAPTPVDPKLVF